MHDDTGGLGPTGLELAALSRSEIPLAAEVVALSLCDNPTHVILHGDNRERRIRILRRMGQVVLITRQHPAIAARQNGAIVAVLSAAPPGTCVPSMAQQLGTLASILRLGPSTASRLLQFGAAAAKHEPKERHWHLGPVTVAPQAQRQGIGSRIMHEFCQETDGTGDATYLETDKLDNVRFYERFGFETVGETELLEVPYWFMRRPPQPLP